MTRNHPVHVANPDTLSTQRLRNMLRTIEESPNGDKVLPTMAKRIRDELARREQEMVAAYVSEGLGE